MRVALSGTPGTGKTTVSKYLSLRYNVLEINEVVDLYPDLIVETDIERDSLVVDIEKLSNRLKDFDGILVGHLAHLLPVDIVVILRTHPAELERRLRKKGFSMKKIRENMEAEALGVITCEALEIHENVFEIDTTNIAPKEVANIVIKIIEDDDFRKLYLAGKIDYSEVILEWY